MYNSMVINMPKLINVFDKMEEGSKEEIKIWNDIGEELDIGGAIYAKSTDSTICNKCKNPKSVLFCIYDNGIVLSCVDCGVYEGFKVDGPFFNYPLPDTSIDEIKLHKDMKPEKFTLQK